MSIGDTVYTIDATANPENIINSGRIVSLDGSNVVILNSKTNDLIFQDIADVFTNAASAKTFGH